ncbi:MAG: tol-pal system YbgF family protein [Candidatus Methylomirabilales bacterium]
MKRWKGPRWSRGVVLAIGACVGLLPIGPPSVLANPLFLSPFEAEKPQNRYYPDEIDDEVRAAIIAAYREDAEALQAHLEALRREDEARRQADRPVTGLNARLRDLYHSILTDRKTFLEAQEEALDDATEPEDEALISWRLDRDELTRADGLYHQGVVTRFGKVLNHLLRSVNLTSFVLDPLVGPAVDSAVNVLLSPGEMEGMSVQERKALVLYQEFLRRYPEDPEAERVEEDVTRLQAKRQEALMVRQVERGEEALEAGNLWTAERHFEAALGADSVSDAAQGGMQVVESRRRLQRDGQAEALRSTPEPPPLIDDFDETLYYNLLLATSRRQPTSMRTAANMLASYHDDDPLWDAAVDAIALAYELEGEQERAHEVLGELAGSGRSSFRQEQASLLLDDPRYNQLVAIRTAERQHFRDTLSFVLGGRETLKKAVVESPTTLLLYGTPAAIPLGAALAAGVGIRGIRALTGNPVSRSAIIEAAGQYLREHPRDDPHYGEVCHLLAQAYEDEQRYDRAIYYYREAGADPEDIRELEERAAETLHDLADEASPRQRARHLFAILRNYPQTEVAREVGRELRGLMAPQYQGLRLSKEFLLEHPTVAQEGLRLKPTLFDDDPDNSEIATDGVTLLEGGWLVITFESPEGPQSQVYNLNRDTAERVLRMLRQGVYQAAFQEAGDQADLLAGQPDLPTFLFARDPADDRVDGEPDVPLRPYEFLGEEERDDQPFLPLPDIQGSATLDGVRLEGLFPYEPFGTRLSFGLDHSSPFVGIEVPSPDPIPFKFLLNVTPDTDFLPSISPQIRLFEEEMKDAPLYK